MIYEILVLMGYYRELARHSGISVQAYPYPQVMYTRAWDTFRKLVNWCRPRGIPSRLYVEAQIAFWPTGGRAIPNLSQLICDNGVPSPSAQDRWQRYLNVLTEDYRGKPLEAARDELTEAIRNSRYLHSMLMRSRPDLHPFKCFERQVQDLHPVYMALHVEFVRTWLHSCSAKFDPVRDVIRLMAEDPVYRTRLLGLRDRELIAT